jgi:hypothetical protein
MKVSHCTTSLFVLACHEYSMGNQCISDNLKEAALRMKACAYGDE